MRNSPRFGALIRSAITTEREIAWRAGYAGGVHGKERSGRGPGAPDDFVLAGAATDGEPAPVRESAGAPAALDGFSSRLRVTLDAVSAGGLGGVAPRLANLAAVVREEGIAPAGAVAVKIAAVAMLHGKPLRMPMPDARQIVNLAFRGEDDLTGQGIDWPRIEPAETAAPLGDILDGIAAACRERVYLPAGAVEVVTAWIAWCYVFERSPVRPSLVITSPVKGCGKTTLLDFLEMHLPKPYQLASITPATFFRMADQYRPQFLLDEADRWLRASENGSERGADLLASLNAGWRIGGKVARQVPSGDGWVTRGFRCDVPKVLAGIGDFPDTVADRSIIVTMERKPAGYAFVERPHGPADRRCIEVTTCPMGGRTGY